MSSAVQKGTSSDGCYVISALFSTSFLISTFFFPKVHETSQEGFQNNASDNLPCRTSVMQMQHNDEGKKKKEWKSLIMFSDPFNAVEQSRLLHVVAIMSHSSCQSFHPCSESTDEHKRLLRTCVGGWAGLVSVSVIHNLRCSE